jgi:hypothetical protein
LAISEPQVIEAPKKQHEISVNKWLIFLSEWAEKPPDSEAQNKVFGERWDQNAVNRE